MTPEQSAEQGGCLGFMAFLADKINRATERTERRIDLMIWRHKVKKQISTREGMELFINELAKRPFRESEATIDTLHGKPLGIDSGCYTYCGERVDW